MTERKISAPLHLFDVLSGIRERVGGTWYTYKHHLIEAKQSDEANKREGMQVALLLSFRFVCNVGSLLASARSFHWSFPCPWSTLNLFISILRDTVSP